MFRWVLTAAAAAIASIVVFATPLKGPSQGSGSAYDNCQTNFTVVVLGSSTAAGTGASPITMAWVPRYRFYLTRISPTNRVINLAIGGYTTYQVLPTGTVPPAKRPAPDPTHNITYAISLKPNAIIVSLPTNDVASGFAMDETTANFKTIAAAARTAGIPLWVTTPQPRNLPVAGRAQLLVLRDFIKETFGPNAIDFMTGLGDKDGKLLKVYDSGDGIHPGNVGHAVLFRRVVAANIPDVVCASALAFGANHTTAHAWRLADTRTSRNGRRSLVSRAQ